MITIGRIVHYTLTEEDCKKINRRRITADQIQHGLSTGKWPEGAQAHFGSYVYAGEVLPMLVTRVYPNEFGEGFPGVNGQVFLDGNDTYWVTSAAEGHEEPGRWHWPAKN